MDLLRKTCMIYYILLDHSEKDAKSFASVFGISLPFVISIKGYWALDHGLHEVAASLLSDPSIDLDWADKILNEFIIHGKYEIAYQFIQAVRPTLKTKQDVAIHMEVLMHIDFLEALLFQRRHSASDSSPELFSKLVYFCFSDKSYLKKLQTYPLRPKEDQWLISICRERPEPKYHDFMIAYFLHRSRFGEAIQEFDKFFGPLAPFADEKGIARQRRIDCVRQVIPAVQQMAFDICREPEGANNKLSQAQTKREVDNLAVVSPTAGLRPLSMTVSMFEKDDSTPKSLLRALQNNYVRIDDRPSADLVLSNSSLVVTPPSTSINDMDVQDMVEDDNEDSQPNTASEAPKLALVSPEVPSPPVSVPIAEPLKQDLFVKPLPKIMAVESSPAQPIFTRPKSPCSPFVQPPFTPRKNSTESISTPVFMNMSPLSRARPVVKTPIAKAIGENVSSPRNVENATPTKQPATSDVDETHPVLSIDHTYENEPKKMARVIASPAGVGSAGPQLVNNSPFSLKSKTPQLTPTRKPLGTLSSGVSPNGASAVITRMSPQSNILNRREQVSPFASEPRTPVGKGQQPSATVSPYQHLTGRSAQSVPARQLRQTPARMQRLEPEYSQDENDLISDVSIPDMSSTSGSKSTQRKSSKNRLNLEDPQRAKLPVTPLRHSATTRTRSRASATPKSTKKLNIQKRTLRAPPDQLRNDIMMLNEMPSVTSSSPPNLKSSSGAAAKKRHEQPGSRNSSAPGTPSRTIMTRGMAKQLEKDS